MRLRLFSLAVASLLASPLTAGSARAQDGPKTPGPAPAPAPAPTTPPAPAPAPTASPAPATLDTSADDAAVEAALRSAAARVAPSVVEIETLGALPEKIEAPAPGQDGEGGGGSPEGLLAKAGFKQANGPSTGVAVAKDLVVTSTFPFAEHPRHVFVTRQDGKAFVAEVLGRDEGRMLALLRVPGADLVPAVAAPRDAFLVGRFAAALGRGLGTKDPAISLGIVSARDRIGGRALQTSASISPVNYGGPLVTIEGQVLGILVPLTAFGGMAGVDLYDSGIGFAIPLVDVQELLPRLEKGAVLEPAFLGIGIDQGRTEDGVLVESVQPGSAAANARLKPKDVIVELDGRPIQFFFQLHQALGRKSAGDKIALGVVRDGTKRTVEVTLGKPPAPQAPGMPGAPPGANPHDPHDPHAPHGDDDDDQDKH